MSQDQLKNLEAESAWARKKLYGSEEAVSESEDMGHTILGDVTNPAPIVIAPQSQGSSGGLSQTLIPLALGASLMGVPAAGLAGYFLSKTQSPVAQPTQQQDETVSIGLRKIEDLLKSK